MAIIKTTNSSLLYLKDKNITKINFDFLNAANLDKINLNNYDLVILEGEIQDDNVFNPEDVEINYIIQNEKIIFKKQKNKVQCCYNALNTNPNESISRNCLGYSYMLNNKNFKKDFTKIFESKTTKVKIKIHYFKNIKFSGNI